MKSQKWALCIAAMALLTCVCPSRSRADLYWETETVSSRHNGTSIQKYYLTPSASRLELGNAKVFILDYNTKSLYWLDTKRKIFSKMNLTKLPWLPEEKSPANKSIGKALEAMIGFRVTRTDEQKTIAGYRCHRCDVHVAMVNGEYWVSEEVGGYQEFRTLGEKVGAVAVQSPLLRQIDLTCLVDKFGGFPVYTVNHVNGGTVASTLKKVEQKHLDPGLFVVPKGYKAIKAKWMEEVPQNIGTLPVL